MEDSTDFEIAERINQHKQTEAAFYQALTAELQHMQTRMISPDELRLTLDLIASNEDESIHRQYIDQFCCVRRNYQHFSLKPTLQPPEKTSEFIRMENDQAYCLASLDAHEKDYFRHMRLSMIGRLLSLGVAVPKPVIDQYSTEQLRLAVHKIRRISESFTTPVIIQIPAEDTSLVDSCGVIVRCQNGSHPGKAELDQIETAMREIIQIIPDIADICRAAGLAITHTQGAAIRSNDTSCLGIYQHYRRNITVGVADSNGIPSLRSLGHELIGHFLDHYCVPPEETLQASFGEYFPVVAKREKATCSALDVLYCNSYSSIYCLAMTMLPVGPDEDKIALIRPGELYARAAELWLSIQLHIADNRDPISVYPTHYLMDQPGYWRFSDLEIFLFEYMRNEVETRLELARKLANLPDPKPVDRLLHPYMLPWSVNPPTYPYEYFDGVNNQQGNQLFQNLMNKNAATG